MVRSFEPAVDVEVTKDADVRVVQPAEPFARSFGANALATFIEISTAAFPNSSNGCRKPVPHVG